MVPASSGTPLQTKKMVLRSRAPSRSSSLSSASALGRSSSVSQQPKKLVRSRSFQSLHSRSFLGCSLPTLTLQGKPLCGLCLYSCSSRLSGRACQSTSAAHSAPFGRCVPLVTAGLFANFLQKQSKRPSATKAKGISVVAVVVLCEMWFFMEAFVNVYKFFDSVEVPAGAGASVVFYMRFFAVFLVLRVVRFWV